jgi:hypothetical protein
VLFCAISSTLLHYFLSLISLLLSLHIAPPDLISSYFTHSISILPSPTPYHTIPYHPILSHFIFSHPLSHHIISYHIISLQPTPHHSNALPLTSHCISPYYVLFYRIPLYIILSHSTILSTLLYSTLLFSFPSFYSILSYPILFYSILFSLPLSTPSPPLLPFPPLSSPLLT